MVSNLEHHSLHGLSTRGITWIKIVNYNYIRKVCKVSVRALFQLVENPLAFCNKFEHGVITCAEDTVYVN